MTKLLSAFIAGAVQGAGNAAGVLFVGLMFFAALRLLGVLP